MHNHESGFRSRLRPKHMLEAFRQLAAEKRREITSEDERRAACLGRGGGGNR